MNIGSSIARLRRERGMTQETLGEMLGVSAQTISKWENQTNCPDVMLLPVIADVFGVSVDALYGRSDMRHVVSPDAAFEQVIEYVRRTIVGAVYHPELDGLFEENLQKYKNAMRDERFRSVIENDRDVLYFRESRGALALRKPEDGWNTLFARDSTAKLLRTLADEDFRKAMQVILHKRLRTFTLSTLARNSGVPDEGRLAQLLTDAGCFARRELMIDGQPLVYYELVETEQRLYLLFASMAFAEEYAEYQPMHYTFIGNGGYVSP